MEPFRSKWNLSVSQEMDQQEPSCGTFKPSVRTNKTTFFDYLRKPNKRTQNIARKTKSVRTTHETSDDGTKDAEDADKIEKLKCEDKDDDMNSDDGEDKQVDALFSNAVLEPLQASYE
jgi:hypothetical protein